MLPALSSRWLCSNITRNFKLLFVVSHINHKITSRLLVVKYHIRYKNYLVPGVKEGPFPSRYHPTSPIETVEKRIKDHLNSKNSLSFDEWISIKHELMADFEMISESNFSSIIMNCIHMLNSIDLANSFMRYLDESKMVPNFLTYLKYMSICSRHAEYCGENIILETFQKIKHLIDAAPVLDEKRTEYVIQGLCATSNWRDSFQYLKKLPQKPNMEIRNSLAAAAIRNEDKSLAWEIITNWLKSGEYPGNNVFKEFLLCALRLQKTSPREADVFIVKVFQYLQAKEFVIDINVAKLIEEYFNHHSSNWSISYSKIRRRGECSNCRSYLKLFSLTEDEFLYLKKSFLERAVRKSDIYINTTQKEFDRYIQFIDQHKPFHIVLDGLNAAYTCEDVKTSRNLAAQLLKVVKSLSTRSRKILVLGRQHMLKWPSHVMHKVSKYAKVFYTHNITQEDPFVIYSALASGPHTVFLSLDLMRDHMARLDDPTLIHLFKKWQQSHQIFAITDNNNLSFMEPLRYSICVQGSMNVGWHIPYDDNVILDPYEELNNWLCIQKV